MKIPLLTLTALTVVLHSFCQKTVFSFQPAADPDLKKSLPYQSYIVSDTKAGKITVILKNKQHAEYLLLDKDFKVEQKFQPADGLMNTIFKGDWYMYLDGNNNSVGTCYYYLVRDKTGHNFNYQTRMEVVDFKNKKVYNKMVFAIPGEETVIDWYANGENFYLVTANDKLNQLVFHVIDKNGTYFSKSVPINFDGFNQYKKHKLTVSEYFSYSHVFRPDEETELVAATDLTKIYVYPDELAIVVASYDEPPHIWTFDTRNFTNASKKKLDMSGFAGFGDKSEKFYTNSCLYGNNLYVLNTSKNKIEIGVFDFASGKLLKKHEVLESSAIPFVETPVEITTKGRGTKKNVINSNKELIKELFKGSSGIALAHNSQGQLIVTCGVYDKEERSGGGYYAGSFAQASMPTGATYAGSNVPVTRTYSNFNSMSNYKNGSVYTYTRTVNFKVIMDPASLNIVDSREKLSSIDKINNLLEAIDRKSQAENSFKLGNDYFICYYDLDNSTFSIKQIER
jgi:hypothetical protein